MPDKQGRLEDDRLKTAEKKRTNQVKGKYYRYEKRFNHGGGVEILEVRYDVAPSAGHEEWGKWLLIARVAYFDRPATSPERSGLPRSVQIR
ncbi:hypothetical protein N7501_009925 [Penicillium viridicatum]|nr:hypothetical protein N7501_009925 [Penicillium viridicatum]